MNLKQEATELMLALLRQEKVIEVSRALREIAREVTLVPEKPKDYTPVFLLKSPKIVVLVTGGLDSTYVYFDTVAKYGDKATIPLYVDFGQPYARKELDALKNLGIKAEVEYNAMTTAVVFGLQKNYWKHIIPARNLLMIATAIERIGDCGGTIMFGAVNGEMPPSGGDKSQRFIHQINDLLASRPIELVVPLKNDTKTDIVRQMETRFPDKVELTISCFSSEPGHCGNCQACLRKWIAFINNGIKLKTKMPVAVGCVEYIDKYRKLMSQALEEENFEKYSRRRCEQTLKAFMKLEEQ